MVRNSQRTTRKQASSRLGSIQIPSALSDKPSTFETRMLEFRAECGRFLQHLYSTIHTDLRGTAISFKTLDRLAGDISLPATVRTCSNRRPSIRLLEKQMAEAALPLATTKQNSYQGVYPHETRIVYSPVLFPKSNPGSGLTIP